MTSAATRGADPELATPIESMSGHRGRLLAGMAAALVEKGYGAVTIADIARHARVSKRTFYEHFADKQECFLAVYAAASDRLLQLVGEAARPELDWVEQVRAAVHAYLSALQNEPALTRTMLLELQSAGPEALRLRRRGQQDFATLLLDRVAQGVREHPGARPISPAMATAVIGGLNELVLEAVEDGRADRLTDLGPVATDFVRAVLVSPQD
ncbi:TetR/AcrR family transcriptional regulator [Cryptosporangium aurantiacum]|uniref:Transcriptional regulator, TetR family n=1 Tax=Cryptosporangium aurantiacum TaxID=134849 RepID=A0A1M7QXG1_9ACTN|nr:TetR/AcrR family transcriptional regulator [Cryptosporangium aurantiacum]SHN36702.1 transcriptional regulator, TetR family [Cryptosporangium aurantiacum]